MKVCLVPSQVLGPFHPALPVIGEIVERIISSDYCRQKGGCERFLAPGAQTDFFDIGMGFHRCDQLVAYLAVHNPGIDTALIGTQCRLKKDSDKAFPVPDIITHGPDRFEFYEVKPNSRSGIDKGKDKILWFEPICDSEALPYIAGTRYSGAVRPVVLFDGRYVGNPVKITLNWERERPGLLVYEFCVEVTQESISEALFFALVALMIAILIALSEGLILVPALAALTSPMRDSIGTGGANATDDVAYAQALLNDWRDRNGRDLIAVDGINGPRTEGAIRDFQAAVTGIVDGRLDPSGQGIVAMEHDHLSTSSANAVPAATVWADAGGTPAVWESIFETPDEAERPIDEITPVPRFETVVAAMQAYLNRVHDTAIGFFR